MLVTRRAFLGCGVAIGAEAVLGSVMPSTPIRLRVGPVPGQLTVINPSAFPVRLRRKVIVEHFNERGTAYIRAGWQPLSTEMNLVATCDRPYGIEPPSGDCVTIGARRYIAVPRWLGAECAGQCDQPCRTNAYFEGKTRFRLQTCDGHDVLSAVFTMPRTLSGEDFSGRP